MSTDIKHGAHQRTTKMDIDEVVRQLLEHLGPTLVAALADVRDRKLPSKWAKPDGVQPRLESERRLRAAHQIWCEVESENDQTIARSWFIGMNPLLGDMEPFMAIREGRLAEVAMAARAFNGDAPDL
jgi:hypothetical protein